MMPENAPVAESSRVQKLSPVGMREGSAANNTMLREFFIEELKDIYWAEQHLVETLPKMRAAASSNALQDAFEKHLGETRGQVKRLEQAFSLMGAPAEAKVCNGMSGIIAEGDRGIEETEAGSATRDAGLVLAAQKVEHYEIATYGGLVQLAKMLGLRQVAGLLDANLAEEKGADKLLTLVAESGINYEAAVEA